MKPSVWFVSELYYPEETSTGYFVTGIAEAVACERAVGVICGHPIHTNRNLDLPRREVRNGVVIERCRNTSFDPSILVFRLINAITISGSMFFKVLSRVNRGDLVVVLTNPPLLPIVVRVAASLRRARGILLVHDVYPDILAATKVVKSRGLVWLLLRMAFRPVYRGFEKIVVLGRDMRDVVAAKVGGDTSRIIIIPNWADTDRIRPQMQSDLRRRLKLQDRFVVQYVGNVGRTHGIDVIVRAAQRLLPDRDVHFLIIGSGSRLEVLRRDIAARGLTNMTLLSRVPGAELSDALSAADVALIAFERGMKGLSVPSRMYNVLASGRPTIAVADEDSELALVVEEERVGWVVSTSDFDALARTIKAAKENAKEREEAGSRARAAAERAYSRAAVLESWRTLIRTLR